MWEVVKRKGGTEKIMAGPLSWLEAYTAYQPLAEQFNAINEDGQYLHPEIRISIRKA